MKSTVLVILANSNRVRNLVFLRAKVEVSTRDYPFFIAAHKPSLGVTRSRNLPPEHAWGSHHPINWKDTSVIDRARRPEELLLKEAIHIQGTPARECLNRDGGKGIPRSWTAALKCSEGVANRRPNRNFQRQITAYGDTQ